MYIMIMGMAIKLKYVTKSFRQSNLLITLADLFYQLHPAQRIIYKS